MTDCVIVVPRVGLMMANKQLKLVVCVYFIVVQFIFVLIFFESTCEAMLPCKDCCRVPCQ